MVGLLKSKYLRLFFCLLLCFCLCFSLFCVPAKAVVSEGIILSAILAALTAANITISGNNISEATFVTQFQRWISTSNINFAALSDDILTLVGANQIKIKASAWSLIDDFIGWLQNDEGLSPITPVYLSKGSAVLSSSPLLACQNVSGASTKTYSVYINPYEYDSSLTLYCCGYGSNNILVLGFVSDIKPAQTTVARIDYGNTTDNITIRSTDRYGDIFYRAYPATYGTVDFWNVPHYDTLQEALAAFDSSFSLSTDGILDFSDIVVPDQDVVLDVSGFDFDSVESYVSGVVPSILDGTFSASIGDQVLDPPADDESNTDDMIFGEVSWIRQLMQRLTQSVDDIKAYLADGVGPSPAIWEPPEWLGGSGNGGIAGAISGIWHYVVSWVGSLGAGLGLFFSVWSGLPYAMVVPIYATAVVVIVVGLFKRYIA